MSRASSTRIFLTFCPCGPVWCVTSCIPRILRARASASSGLFASLTPPPSPRPPAWICALTTARPPNSFAIRPASSGESVTRPRGVATPNPRRTSFAWYSWIFMATADSIRTNRGRSMSKLIHAVHENRPHPPPLRGRRAARRRAGPAARRDGGAGRTAAGGGRRRDRPPGRDRAEVGGLRGARVALRRGHEGGAARRRPPRLLDGHAAARRCPARLRRAAHEDGGGVHARVLELRVREAAHRAATHDASGRPPRRDVPLARVGGPAGLDRPRVREPVVLPRARGVRGVRPRDAARDALAPEGGRALPRDRPRPRVGAARPRRDGGRRARLPGPRAGPRVARGRRAALREEDEDVPEGARGDARHDAQGRGARRRRRRPRRAARGAGGRPGAGLRPRPQPRRAARAADRADGRKDGRDRPPRGAIAPHVRRGPRPGGRALRAGRERHAEGDGPVAPPRGERARGPLRRAAALVPDGDDLRGAAGLLARAPEGEPGG